MNYKDKILKYLKKTMELLRHSIVEKKEFLQSTLQDL